MKEALLNIVRCPACSTERSFELDVSAEDTREIRRGSLRCRDCGHRALIDEGVVNLLHDPPDFVVREAAGLGRFAETMRRDGWDRQRILSLPHEDQRYWWAQEKAMSQLLDTVDPRPGARILDVGSNTCWASAIFAERGLDVVALDIALPEMQGLRTADWWFEGKDVFFERVLSVMFDPALADGSFDYAFCCEVLHHNDRRNLFRTFRELFRILRPGGQVLVVNEPLRNLREPMLNPGSEVAQYEGYEHAYIRCTYTRAARRAGFEVNLLAPHLHEIFRDETWSIDPATSTLHGFRLATANVVRRSERARKLYLAYKSYVGGGTSLFMIAKKPRADRPDKPRSASAFADVS